jgi:ABC-type branched-subunit amino acid transport system ATPase component
MTETVPPILSVQGVTLRFGGVVALDSISFDIFSGQIAGLIGPNGAGKTRLFNCLSRLFQPNAGDITFRGRSVLRVPRYRIPAIGIGRTFQNVALSDRPTVLENVMIGRQACRSQFGSGWHWRARLRLNPSCCCWTNPQPASTMTRYTFWRAKYAGYATSKASRFCWPNIT